MDIEEVVGLLQKSYRSRELEDEVMRFWRESGAYNYVKKIRSNATKWYFLDGPPFPSSDTPHPGTAWNKILKDVMIRYKRMRGHDVHDQPGYDCHGLPIEMAIEKSLGVREKQEVEAAGLEHFVTECGNFALENSKSMTRVFSDLGVWMDWEHPYMTNSDEYIESVWWAVKQAHKNGLLEHSLRVVHWCPRCETVLSDYEVAQKYTDVRDPSIYVKFPVKGRQNEYIVVWTTTPWTLPSNVAVMVNPNLEYARVTDGKNYYIMAKDRVAAVSKETGLTLGLVDTFPGSNLESLEYESPLVELVPAQRDLRGGHRVVLSSEYVHIEEGTGCVHSAPGHGEEDYEVGARNKLPVLMLIDDRGKFLKEAGSYFGKATYDANPDIVENLKRAGFLLHSDFTVHRAPLCWRCDTQLIIRATQQWTMLVTKFKEQMLQAVDATKWVPDWAGASQFKNWLVALKDWVISRQRFWGSPLPIWQCTTCGSYDVIGSRRELLDKSNNKLVPEQLHRPWVDKVTLSCECGGVKTRVPDVIVGWFDSGSCSYASLNYPKDSSLFDRLWPADFIVEGRDQISGWFFALLRCGLLALQQPSYRSVLMHGFMADEQGREMHKSLGNFVAPQDVIAKVGRDPLRYYLLQATTWEDPRFSWRVLEQSARDLTTIWNVFVFASTYMNLDKFNPHSAKIENIQKQLRIEDLWILSRTQSLIKVVTEMFEDYRVHEAMRMLRVFLTEELSHNYVRWVRRRTWVERDDPDKIGAYATLYHALRTSMLLLAPLIPFLTEAVYQAMFRAVEPGRPLTVHALKWPTPRQELLDAQLESEMRTAQAVISAVAKARMTARLKLRQPVRKVTVVSDDPAVNRTVKKLNALLLDQTNSKELRLLPKTRGRTVARVTVTPNPSILGPEFKSLAKRIERKLASLNGEKVRAAFEKKGLIHIRVGTKRVALTPRHVHFAEALPQGVSAGDFEGGRVFVDRRLTRTELAEGLARDLVRRMQQMRKEMDLKVDAFVDVRVRIPDAHALRLLSRMEKYIKQEVRVRDLKLSTRSLESNGFYAKDWEINANSYRVAMKIAS